MPAAFDGGTSASAPTTATIAMGTLIRKVDPQAWSSRSQPATSGPTAMARPEVAVQPVMALARSPRGKIATSRDKVAGMTTAAPTPMTARAAMTSAVSSTRLPITDPPAKISRPTIRAPRRLYLSPIAPRTSISAAYGTV